MDNTSLPRFIQTQTGEYISVAAICIMRIQWITQDIHSVVAVMGSQWEAVIGGYDSYDDANRALNSIMSQFSNEEQQFAVAPARNFRTAQVDE